MVKATDLTEITNPADGDVLGLWLADGSASRRLTIANLRQRAYGSVYASGATGNQAITATASKVTQLATNGAALGGVTADQANNRLQLPAATWEISMSAVWTMSVAANVELWVYAGATATHIMTAGANAAAADLISGAAIDLLTLGSASDIEVYALASAAGDLGIKNLNLTAKRVS